MDAKTKKELNSLTLKLVSDEARELSTKLQNTVYVIRSNNTLYTTLSKGGGTVLCVYKLGNELK